MRIVLQNASSGLYVKEPGTWTDDVQEALSFGSSLHAIRYMRQQRLPDVEVLVAFLDGSLDDWLTIQINANSRVRPAA